MFIDLDQIAPVEVGPSKETIQPAILDVTPSGQRPASVWCPVLIDRAAGVAEMRAPFRMSQAQAHRAAVAMGEG